MSWFFDDGLLLENMATLSAKGATFRCIWWGISKNEGLKS